MASGKRIQWTDMMEFTLAQDYPTRMNSDIARDFGISVRAGVYKARQMGLKKSPDFWAVNRDRIIELRSRPTRRLLMSKGRFQKGNRHGKATWFRPGHGEDAEALERRRLAISRARLAQNYDEMLRKKYGLRRLTRVRLSDKTNYYINKKNYLKDDY